MSSGSISVVEADEGRQGAMPWIHRRFSGDFKDASPARFSPGRKHRLALSRLHSERNDAGTGEAGAQKMFRQFIEKHDFSYLTSPKAKG